MDSQIRKTLLVIIFVILFSFAGGTFIYVKKIGPRMVLLATDFVAYYTGGKMLAVAPHEKLYDFNLQYSIQKQFVPEFTNMYFFYPFRNPPFMALIFVPLIQLPLSYAYFIWLFFNLFFYGLVCLIIADLLKAERLPDKIIVFLGVLIFPPIWITLLIGQISLLLVLSFLLSYQALKKNSRFKAGLWLSLLIIKPQYIILPFVLLIIHRKFRVLAGLLTGISLLTTVSMYTVGLNGLFSFVNSLLNTLQWKEKYNVLPKGMYSWRSFLQLGFGEDMNRTVFFIYLFGLFLIFCISLLIWKRWKSSSSQFSLQWAALVISALLISPYANIQDTCILIVSSVLGIVWIKNKSYYAKMIYAVILLSGYILLFFADTITSHLNINVPVIFMFFSLIMILISLRTPSSQQLQKLT